MAKIQGKILLHVRSVLVIFGVVIFVMIIQIPLVGTRLITIGHLPVGPQLERNKANEAFDFRGIAKSSSVRIDNTKALAEFEGYKGNPAIAPQHDIASRTPDLSPPPMNAFKITWLRHASFIVDIQGKRLLLDPMFSKRVSPLQAIGPKAYITMPVQPQQLGPIEAVIISHDHYDHLDYHTVRALDSQTRLFIVPLGVDSHLLEWGINPAKIVALSPYQSYQVAPALKVTLFPVFHFTGRLLKRNASLAGAWGIKTQEHNIYFGGDTGVVNAKSASSSAEPRDFSIFKDIGETYGPFTVALMGIGAYSEFWASHLTPIEALKGARLLRAQYMIPMHWTSFTLQFHPWKEPGEILARYAEQYRQRIVLPPPGMTWVYGTPPPQEKWWRSIQ